MIETIHEAFGPAEILINNAAKATSVDFLRVSEETWAENGAVTPKGSFVCSQAVLEDMAKDRSGVIPNISSVNAFAYAEYPLLPTHTTHSVSGL